MANKTKKQLPKKRCISKTKRSRSNDFSYMKSRRKLAAKKDYSIIIYFATLVITSIVLTYSISPALAVQSGQSEWTIIIRQVINISIGIVGFVLASRIPTIWWRKLELPLLGLTMASFIALLIPGLGLEVLGATRWIEVAGFTVQPVELAKFTLIIYFASFLTSRKEAKKLNKTSYTLAPLMAVIALVGLFVVVFQKDLGSMIVIIVIALTMLFSSGIKINQMFLAGGTLAAASAIAAVTVPHRLARLTAFFSPETASEESLYQVEQSLIAISTGGLWGKGLGKSVQVYGYLPQAANDSIFSIFAEKVGFIGSVALLLVYGALIYSLLLIVDRSKNYFEKLLVSGTLAWIFTHTAINIAAMLELIPLTGITLPFISFGGTSIVFIMTALGVSFSCSENSKMKGSHNV